MHYSIKMEWGMGNGGASVLSLEEGVGYLLSCISNWFNIYH